MPLPKSALPVNPPDDEHVALAIGHDALTARTTPTSAGAAARAGRRVDQGVELSVHLTDGCRGRVARRLDVDSDRSARLEALGRCHGIRNHDRRVVRVYAVGSVCRGADLIGPGTIAQAMVPRVRVRRVAAVRGGADLGAFTWT